MEGFFKPLIAEPVKHLYKLATDREYFTYCRFASRLWWVPRYKPRSVRIHNHFFRIPDAMSFVYMYKEIFVNKIYEFPASGPIPKILDLGANIGLSVLFFKLRYPDSEITAVEADPKIFSYLEQNIIGNNMGGIKLLNKAVWNETKTIDFHSEGADMGSINPRAGRKIMKISTIDIRDILSNTCFDFIKMDIEGSEKVILPVCRNYLSATPFIFVEYHSQVGESQGLSDIISLLEESGFRIHFHPVRISPAPFNERTIWDGFDMQINIFGWREKRNL